MELETENMMIVSKKGGKGQESIQSSTTPDPGYHIGKWSDGMTSSTRRDTAVCRPSYYYNNVHLHLLYVRCKIEYHLVC